jgi:hypothetical protein
MVQIVKKAKSDQSLGSDRSSGDYGIPSELVHCAEQSSTGETRDNLGTGMS